MGAVGERIPEPDTSPVPEEEVGTEPDGIAVPGWLAAVVSLAGPPDSGSPIITDVASVVEGIGLAVVASWTEGAVGGIPGP